MRDIEFDERDLRLLHALQVRPRAPWTALSSIVGADAVTLARRWAVLQDTGLAWMTSYRGEGARSVGAVVEISCIPSTLAGIVNDLARERVVITIDQTAGSRDLVLCVLCASEAELTAFLLERLPNFAGITSTRTHRIIRILTDAQNWRLKSLHENEVRALERAVPPPHAGKSLVPDSVEDDLTRILLIDGRAPVSDLAQWLRISPARAKGALSNILGAQRVVVRLDIARTFSPWPVSVWYFLRVPPAKIAAVAAALAGLDAARLVATTGGQYSLLLSVWLRRVEDMAALERQLGERLPSVEIGDRSIVLRTPKHMGKRLYPDGRRIV
ncbi:Lrp/AsnC family transcriptional regulator [Paenarthrobacter sp. JL.01a]|uniref:Lrp/AsnC family transcriptional regulator n=1 Tax=Paenarthrobacter sp. JL.01a TaxID=2979324 RepID=UPI0021CABBBF|nr:Lrp/AsnC family transcriptional regulator [Paenarthrobacter sp. JL.01a]UXM93259.1 Lrp/AsnC family transcriptional regulator [Paenarthrobacter sp. JL.01a]